MQREIGIGIVGGGYMGKAHAAAFSAVGPVFGPALRPRLAAVAASSRESAERYAAAFGFARAAADWQGLVDGADVEAVVIASPQESHREIAEAALSLGKPVLCEKPLAARLDDARAMAAAAEGKVAMVGFNYAGTPAFQHAKALLEGGAIGQPTYFRGEHTEDFLADPALPGGWRVRGAANGALGDLAPHILFAATELMGPVASVSAMMETCHGSRPDGDVTNDDQLQALCRFEAGQMGHLMVSRIATGRKMGLIFEVTGTKGALRFNQEDQNALWLYRAEGPEAERGFAKILSGPAHPDYAPFCQGPGHGTGYQDQIIIQAAKFLAAIAGEGPAYPDFAAGTDAMALSAAIGRSAETGTWCDVAPK